MNLIPPESKIYRFHLVRDEDETGVSGTGHVASGIMFEDEKCAMRWRTDVTSVAVYDSIDDLIKIHGHGGRTRVKWVDYPPGYERGVLECYQDRCEGIPPMKCVTEGRAPDRIPEEQVRWFVYGYSQEAPGQFGEDWREFTR